MNLNVSFFNLLEITVIIVGTGQATVALKGSNVGVLFQNSDGNINMGVWFQDPDVEAIDIIWFNTLALAMWTVREEGLILIDEEFSTMSCYVELHR